MRHLVRILCALLLVANVGTAMAAGTFQRGVNLSRWLDTYAKLPMSDQELHDLRAAGFDHVRLPIDPVALGWSPEQGPGLRDAPKLRAAIAAVLAADLDVIVDMHPEPGIQQPIIEDEHADDFVALWTWLATQLKHTPSNRVALELLNEPQYSGFGGSIRWSRYQKRLLQAVRAVLPRHQVIVSGRQTGSLEGLLELSPLADANLIYSFHFYLPGIFTHQGADWMRDVPWTTAGHWRNVRYPSMLAMLLLPHMDGTGDRRQAREEIFQYFKTGWDRREIAAQWRPLVEWARKYPGVRIRLGEFGVIRAGVDPLSRYLWIADVRSQAEANGWGWTLWDYGANFGITTRSNDNGMPRGALEPQALYALGLGRHRR